MTVSRYTSRENESYIQQMWTDLKDESHILYFNIDSFKGDQQNIAIID